MRSTEHDLIRQESKTKATSAVVRQRPSPAVAAQTSSPQADRDEAGVREGSLVRNKQRQDRCRNHRQELIRCSLDQLRLPGTPVKAVQLICRDDTNHHRTLCQNQLKWTPSKRAITERNRARQPLRCRASVRSPSSSPSRLLTTCLGCEFRPNQISSISDRCGWHRRAGRADFRL